MTDIHSFRIVLLEGARQYGISLDNCVLDSFLKYYDLLSLRNTRFNLVSKRDIGRFVEYHLLDSLKVASVFDFSPVKTMLDFGSGAGLPGIPISLVFPHISITMVESRSKRCAFLEEVILSIPNLRACVINSRIETFPFSHNDTFDVVITRATVSLKKFFTVASGFLSPGGSLIAIKGDHIDEEISELKTVLNEQLFHLKISSPSPVTNVRSGNIVLVIRL